MSKCYVCGCGAFLPVMGSVESGSVSDARGNVIKRQVPMIEACGNCYMLRATEAAILSILEAMGEHGKAA